MDTQLDASAAELFKAATDRDTSERLTFLDNACGKGTPLRAKVEILLRADEAAGDFLDATAPAPGLTVPLEPAAPMIGAQVGRYRIDRLIGSGGMGSVYEATQDSPRRTVALKIMRSGIISASTLRRFEYEAQVLAQLHHPGVVQIYEAGVFRSGTDAAAVPYFAMEYIPDARNILEFARERGLSVREKLELFSDVCDAVHHGHQKAVIHRDLKPGNILVDAGGQPKVIDFGVARAVGSDLAMTTVHSGIGQIIGTLRYMSPEQCDADPLAIDIRSDVYALGVVLYEMLTGVLPYDVSSGPIAHALHVIREAPPGRLSAIDRSLRGDIDTIVMKCLAKERERRYQGVGELAEDIRRYLDQRPIAARPPTVMYQLRTFARRNKLLVGGTAVLLASLVAGIIGTSWGLIEAHKQTRAARFQAYVANVIGADAALQIGDTITAKQRLNDAPVEYRNWEWRFLDNHLDASVRTIGLGNSNASVTYLAASLAVSPDGQAAALSGGRVLSLSTGNSIAMLGGMDDSITAVAWSPNGRSILTADNVDATARTWDAASGRLLTPFRGHTGEVNAVAFSPNGLRIATGSLDYSVKVWDVKSGVCTATMSEHQGGVRWVAFSPDGARVVSASLDGTAKIWSTEGGPAILTLTGHATQVASVEFDNQGRRVVSSGLDGTVRVWDAHTGIQLLELRGPTRALCAEFSPKGQVIATGWTDSAIRLWDSNTGELLSILRGHAGGVIALNYTTDGRYIVSGGGDGTIKLWNTATVPDTTQLRGHINETVSVSFSPDGRLIASAGFDTTVRLWDAASGEETNVFVGHEGYVKAVAFSPDGTTIASGGGDHTIRLWNVTDGREFRVLHAPGNDVWGITLVAFSPDGHRIISTGNATASMWELEQSSDAPTWQTQDLGGESIAFSPDGAYFLDVASDKNLRIRYVHTREVARVLRGHTGGSQSAKFSPDGRIVASVGDDRTLRIWDARSGEPLQVIAGLNADPGSLAFYPDADGSRLAVCFRDGTVRLWDTRNWQIVNTFRYENGGWLYSIAFDPQGQRLACGSTLSSILLWDSDPISTRTAATAAAIALRIEAEPIVAHLLDQDKNPEKVMARLEADRSLGDGVRTAAMRLVRTRAGRPEELFRTTWDIVRNPQATSGQIQRARAMANSLLRPDPNNPQYLTTLGMARFRAGAFPTALEVLLQARKLITSENPRTHAATLAFLAMCQFRENDHLAAESSLRELHSFVSDPATTADEQITGFLNEAETLIQIR